MNPRLSKPFYRWSSQELIDHLKRLDRKSQIKLLSFLSGLLFFVFFIFWPAWFQRLEVGRQIETLKSQIRLGQIRIKEEPRLLQERKEAQAFVEAVKARLLKEGEGEGIVGILAGIAEKSGVTLVSTEPQLPEQDKKGRFPAPFDSKYREVSYKITLEGGYHELAAFVSQIENHARIFRVGELSITPRQETPRIHLGEIFVSSFVLQGRKRNGG